MNQPQDHNYIEPDVLLVHKPKGITSFDVVRRLRKILNIRKIGHAGTLDPLAHGLMIVGIESGTKKMDTYLKLPKTYIAEVLCGMSTTTGDLEGEVVQEKSILKSDFKEKHIQEALDSMVGEHQLPVPLYSAIKVEGKALYQYARDNEKPPYVPVKEMHVTRITLLDNYVSGKHYIIKIRIDVSSGTYIRTLGEELGKRLGYPATLKGLYRVKIGEFEDQHAFVLPDDTDRAWYTESISRYNTPHPMNIFFQSQNLELDQTMKNSMTARLSGLEKFFSPEAQISVSVEKTRSSHNGDDLYFVSLQIEDGKYRYYTDEYEENVRKSFDNAYDEMFRIVRDDKKKSRSLARRAGAQLKKLFRRKR